MTRSSGASGDREPERRAGLTVPLFSLRSHRDFGIGEIGDLPRLGDWARGVGFRVLQLLPTFELARGETSPYGARTAFGLDPIYISLRDVPELDASVIHDALGPSGEAELAALRARKAVDYVAVRAIKERVLGRAFQRFVEREIAHDTPRARAFRDFRNEAGAWEDDLSLYVAIRSEREEHGWSTWPAGLRDREPRALQEARERLARPILQHAYAQFVAGEQWAAARRALKERGVALMGDLPFIVGGESADAWAHRHLLRTDVSLGAPPDAYSEEGQDWGLPAYDFARLEQEGFSWLTARTRRARQLYDLFRIDHVVGYFRQWIKPRGAQKGHFDLPSERVQEARGRAVLTAMVREAGPGAIVAEDLGVIPHWVRGVMRSLSIPGYRVLPWERDGDVVRDPRSFPPLSVATWSTHDTAPIALWWREMTPADRGAITAMMAGSGADVAAHATGAALFEAHMRSLFGSGSSLALALLQEILGEDQRINTPGTVGPENWTTRMATPIEALATDVAVARRAKVTSQLLREAKR